MAIALPIIIESQKGKKSWHDGGQTFCFVLLNEEIALLKLVTLKSEESRPNSVAVILASSSSGSGRHLEHDQVVWTRSNKSTLEAYLVFATCRQVSLRKASLSSGLSTINCTTYLGRQEMIPRASQLSWKPYILSRRSSVSLHTIATKLLVAWKFTVWKI